MTSSVKAGPHSNQADVTSALHCTIRIFSNEEIANLRRKSLRRGIWFRALSRSERGVIDLTLRCVQRVRSHVLIRVLQTVLSKLSEAVEHFFAWRLEQVGRPIAEMLTRVAVSWGVTGAKNWEKDIAYLRCLGLNYLSSNMWRT